jgi:recombinational DNA repair ATPase RecF
VTGHRTALDYAEILRKLVDECFPEAKRILVVQDNLNTHSGASLYKAFDAREALRIHKKLEFHYTPKHASWLNMAEIEIHALGKQCIDRRIGDIEKLKHEIAVWETERNQRQVNVNWQFTVNKARSKFQKSYDKLNN